jgi:hypothetical protein
MKRLRGLGLVGDPLVKRLRGLGLVGDPLVKRLRSGPWFVKGYWSIKEKMSKRWAFPR